MACGAAGQEMKATEEVQKIVDEVHREVIVDSLPKVKMAPKLVSQKVGYLKNAENIWVKSQAEAKAGTTFNEFKAISYRVQVVAGQNYFVKVKVGDSSYIHLRIYQTLPHDGSRLELTAIKTGLSEGDSLDYF